MSWKEIVGHEPLVDRFRRAMARGRLASSFLFVGPPGVGKRTFAFKLAEVLLCWRQKELDFDACGQCDWCAQVRARTHPDLITAAKPADKTEIPLELLIGDREHRMRAGLCHDIGLKPFYGGRKIAIIDDADDLNEEGANCLLKTLEEPPERSVIILIGTSEYRQLPTIRSRCQIVRFQPLTQDQLADLLVRQGDASDHQEARKLAQLGAGSMAHARFWRDPDVNALREKILAGLAATQGPFMALYGELTGYLSEVSQETQRQRERMAAILSTAHDFYRQQLRACCDQPPEGDERLVAAAGRASSQSSPRPENTVAALNRTLQAEVELRSNASPALLLHAWLDELGQIHQRP